MIKISIKYPHKILIIKPSSLGDVVHSLPFLNSVRKCFPQAEIHWIIARELEGLLQGHPMVNKLWIINKDEWKKIKNVKGTISELNTLFKKLKREKFDIVVDLQGLLRSGVLTAATSAPVRVGFSEAREGSKLFYTHKIKGGRDIHAVDRYLKIADFLGCDITDIRFPLPDNQSPSSIFHPSSLIPHTSEDYAVMVPGARKPANRWPARRFGELASVLPVETVVIGSMDDRILADEVVEASKGKAISIAGKTDLKSMMEVIKGARFMVTNDTGPMHIAVALGIRVFAIFGPADPARTGPYGEGHFVIREDVSCGPCFRRTCSDMKCMNDLSAGKVYEIIREKIAI